ncbi:MAG: hypothetical protein JWM87_3734 [Candidatus Eremiobacteraeota bacterium]|nr:hypothetical protein [Candidatus Eremiobacteraeota bacterium]
MFEFIQRFFGKPASSATAKERLRLVLLSDHLSLAPDVVEALKRDLIDVISRYVDVDRANCDVTFEQQEKQVAMLANIPILAMRSRATPPTSTPPAPPPPAAAREPEPPPSLDLGGATASVAAEPEAATLIDATPAATAPARPAADAAVAAPAPARAKQAPANGGSRKRRRKRPAGAALPSAG